ncbi:MAG: OmpH family outer membrane protein [Candidatus Latescibacteria bacterium]|nr:OmpH family outer membrane protein [Candidatus Latescibacterota bacterium]
MINIRKILTVCIVVITLQLFYVYTAHSETKIGYVRSGYILRNYEPYKQAMKEFQALEDSENEKFKKMTDDFQEKVAAAQKQAAFMSQEKIAEKSQELERENALLEQYSAKVFDRDSGILSKKYNDLIKPVFDHVNSIIKKTRIEEGYDFIFESESDSLIDADEKYDLSDKVLAMLEKEPMPTTVSTEKKD